MTDGEGSLCPPSAPPHIIGIAMFVITQAIRLSCYSAHTMNAVTNKKNNARNVHPSSQKKWNKKRKKSLKNPKMISIKITSEPVLTAVQITKLGLNCIWYPFTAERCCMSKQNIRATCGGVY